MGKKIKVSPPAGRLSELVTLYLPLAAGYGSKQQKAADEILIELICTRAHLQIQTLLCCTALGITLPLSYTFGYLF